MPLTQHRRILYCTNLQPMPDHISQSIQLFIQKFLIPMEMYLKTMSLKSERGRESIEDGAPEILLSKANCSKMSCISGLHRYNPSIFPHGKDTHVHTDNKDTQRQLTFAVPPKDTRQHIFHFLRERERGREREREREEILFLQRER